MQRAALSFSTSLKSSDAYTQNAFGHAAALDEKGPETWRDASDHITGPDALSGDTTRDASSHITALDASSRANAQDGSSRVTPLDSSGLETMRGTFSHQVAQDTSIHVWTQDASSRETARDASSHITALHASGCERARDASDHLMAQDASSRDFRPLHASMPDGARGRAFISALASESRLCRESLALLSRPEGATISGKQARPFEVERSLVSPLVDCFGFASIV